jgi:hypothetical protein
LASASQLRSVSPLPMPIRIWGWLAILGSSLLAADLVWEQTILNWTRGPQMVGFSLAHTFGVALIPFPLLLIPWLVVVGGISLRDRLKRRAVGWYRLAAFLGAVLVLASMTVPHSVWQRVFAGTLADGPFASEFLTFNAATGDVATMAVLIRRGVPVDSRTAEGETSLHVAARLGRLDVIAFLASNGADPNARDSHDYTPLDAALSSGQRQAAQLLAQRFGDRLAPSKPRVGEPVHVTVRPEPSQ